MPSFLPLFAAAAFIMAISLVHAGVPVIPGPQAYPLLQNPRSVPLYTTSGRPQVDDIKQFRTPDCFLEAVLAAIVRLDPKVITDMLHDEGDGNVTVSLYDINFKRVTEKVVKRNHIQGEAHADSGSTWVAVIQDAFDSRWKKDKSMSDVRHGGFPGTAMETIYGRKAYSWPCKDFDRITSVGSVVPMVMATQPGDDGLLAGSHVYTVYSGDVKHAVLRNPWGDDTRLGGSTVSTDSNVVKAKGNGVFEVANDQLKAQCMFFTTPSVLMVISES